ncbi:cysteine desulfurase family protein [Vagococcus intermedius]|uniref:Cysteine desulfurase n=1 Tax=Vagococcus intermedius TaxID=2991418 RepID=A0AAF0I6Z2_9ENTE|nr:cysteine desulfurase family protein [Vagococcus intermedius]WEG73918.1 cysteine desulfurase [Vagococcus intermedius]WEG76000.1 cysteine desulfurase [Vagococcus intermedius]
MIYFDNSATTAIHPSVLDTYVKTSQRILGNPSSLHQLGSQATRLITQSRQQIAENLGVDAEEIYFTSGGTEGDNWVIKGTAMEKKEFGNHIIISAIEHSAVSKAAEQLTKFGFAVSILPVDKKGHAKVSELKKLIRKETILVSVMAVNNEIGSVQPIKEIGDVLKNYPTIHFHVDAVQALGKIPTEMYVTDRVDFATFSSHKFHGPKGTGFIYWRKGRRLAPLLNGGGQEGNKRSGTENVPGIVAMAKAVRLHVTDQELKNRREANIKQYLIDSLSQYDKVTLFSEDSDVFAPHILCFGLKGIKGEVLVHAFEKKDIIISTTSACSSKSKVAGGTLHGMGIPDDIAITAVRVSLTAESSMVEAEQFMIVFKQLQEQFSKIND